jgi:hypothetical protein
MKTLLLLLSLTISLQWLPLPTRVAAATPAAEQIRLRQDLQQILADQRFNYPDYWAWWQRLAAKWSRWLARLQPRRHELKAAWFEQLIKRIGLGLVILLPLVLLYFARQFLAWENRLKATAANRADPDAALTALVGHARRAAEQDDYRNAIRYFYLAVLLQLRASGRLPAGNNSCYSDHENLRLLRKKLGGTAPEFQAFNRLVLTFQEKWYGLKSCDRTDCQTAGQLFKIITQSGAPKKW